jgi:hypothetical protein
VSTKLREYDIKQQQVNPTDVIYAFDMQVFVEKYCQISSQMRGPCGGGSAAVLARGIEPRKKVHHWRSHNNNNNNNNINGELPCDITWRPYSML